MYTHFKALAAPVRILPITPQLGQLGIIIIITRIILFIRNKSFGRSRLLACVYTVRMMI